MEDERMFLGIDDCSQGPDFSLNLIAHSNFPLYAAGFGSKERGGANK